MTAQRAQRIVFNAPFALQCLMLIVFMFSGIVFEFDSQPCARGLRVPRVSCAGSLHEECYVIDVGSGTGFDLHYTNNYVPCLTRRHAGQSGFYSTYHKRLLTTRDTVRLQAMPLKYVKTDKVSEHQKRV